MGIKGYDDWKLASPYDDDPDEVDWDKDEAVEFLEAEGLDKCEGCGQLVVLLEWTKWESRCGSQAVRVAYQCVNPACEVEKQRHQHDAEVRSWADIQADRADAEYDRRRDDW